MKLQRTILDKAADYIEIYRNSTSMTSHRIARKVLSMKEEEMEALKTIKQTKISDVKYIGIIRAKNWYKEDGLSFIFPDDYVVCEWCDYHDGVNSHIEGKTTIGILKLLEDAVIVYHNRLTKQWNWF